MQESYTCPFCFEKDRIPYNYQDEDYANLVEKGETRLYETESFCVFPDFGPICVGHALVVPKNHITSLAMLSDKEMEELCNLISFMREKISTHYKLDIECFEHGSGTDMNQCMSCVSHAHLHIIPTKVKTVLDQIPIDFMATELKELIDDKEAKRDGYLLFIDADGKCFYAKNEVVISQFFRQHYAKTIGEISKWDWRHFQDNDLQAATLKFYKEMLG